MKRARLFDHYLSAVRAELVKELNLDNCMRAPKLEKISVNFTSSDLVNDPKSIETYCYSLMLITGQKPVICRAKKSIAGYKLREGMAIGCKVTLRRNTMYEFLDRMVNIVLPRVRDFRGVNSRAFDGRGNFSLGFKDNTVFPEINYDNMHKSHGLNVIFVTTAQNDDEGRLLLKKFDIPFM